MKTILLFSIFALCAVLFAAPGLHYPSTHSTPLLKISDDGSVSTYATLDGLFVFNSPSITPLEESTILKTTSVDSDSGAMPIFAAGGMKIPEYAEGKCTADSVPFEQALVYRKLRNYVFTFDEYGQLIFSNETIGPFEITKAVDDYVNIHGRVLVRDEPAGPFQEGAGWYSGLFDVYKVNFSQVEPGTKLTEYDQGGNRHVLTVNAVVPSRHWIKGDWKMYDSQGTLIFDEYNRLFLAIEKPEGGFSVGLLPPNKEYENATRIQQHLYYVDGVKPLNHDLSNLDEVVPSLGQRMVDIGGESFDEIFSPWPDTFMDGATNWVVYTSVLLDSNGNAVSKRGAVGIPFHDFEISDPRMCPACSQQWIIWAIGSASSKSSYWIDENQTRSETVYSGVDLGGCKDGNNECRNAFELVGQEPYSYPELK